MLVTMAREDMRASDGDRSEIAERLKTALDEGRLDLTEYDERLQKTYQAKTYGELEGLLSDLPGPRPAATSQGQPVPPTPVAPAAGPSGGEQSEGAPWP